MIPILESDIKFGANAQPVKLPEASTVPAGDVEAVLIGWGRNITGGPVQDILKKISYTKFSDAHCQGTEPKYNPNYHVCAGIPGGGKGQCNLDPRDAAQITLSQIKELTMTDGQSLVYKHDGTKKHVLGADVHTYSEPNCKTPKSFNISFSMCLAEVTTSSVVMGIQRTKMD
ncbi:uncharacterized protein CBL_07357 [Carabus blaptoides fortunei]